MLVSCIRSSPYYFEAFRADWKRVFYSILSGAKAAVGTLYPANYEYTTLGRTAIAALDRRFLSATSMGITCCLRATSEFRTWVSASRMGRWGGRTASAK